MFVYFFKIVLIVFIPYRLFFLFCFLCGIRLFLIAFIFSFSFYVFS